MRSGSVVPLALLFLCTHAFPATVTVDGTDIHQTMDGWSTEESIWDDPHLTKTFRPPNPGEEPFGRSAVTIPISAQSDILDKLYQELKLTHVNPVFDNGMQSCATCPYEFRWKINDGHIDWVKQAQSHGLQKWQLFFFKKESWMSDTDPSDLIEYEMAHARRWRDQGVEPQYIVPYSEPSYNAAGPAIAPGYVRELIRGLGRKLAAEGFGTKIVAPDDINTGYSLVQLQTIMADQEVRDYIAAISTHLYGDGFELSRMGQIRDLFATPYNKPLWMGEYFRGPGGLGGTALDYAELMHELISRYNVSLVNYEWGYFGQWEAPSIHLISIQYDSNNNYTGYSIDKAYYTFGQFSRFVPAGSVRVGASSDDPATKVTAYKAGDGLAIVAVNNTDTAKDVSFNLIGFDGVGAVQGVRTSESENWAGLSAIPVSGGSFAATLPARSVTTFTSQ